MNFDFYTTAAQLTQDQKQQIRNYLIADKPFLAADDEPATYFEARKNRPKLRRILSQAPLDGLNWDALPLKRMAFKDGKFKTYIPVSSRNQEITNIMSALLDKSQRYPLNNNEKTRQTLIENYETVVSYYWLKSLDRRVQSALHGHENAHWFLTEVAQELQRTMQETQPTQGEMR